MDRMVNDLLTYGEVLPEPELGVTVLQTGVPLKDGLTGLEVLYVNPGSAADRGRNPGGRLYPLRRRRADP